MLANPPIETAHTHTSPGQGTATLAAVMRGEKVESVHSGTIVVADQLGNVVAWAGEPSTFAYFRSSAKPFQAVSVIESGAADAFNLTSAELALCCASHYGAPMHQEQVTKMLAKIGLTPDALQCGSPLPADMDEMARVQAGIRDRSPLHCDCSGKHSGMLATCVHLGLPVENYLSLDHPLQQNILANVADLMQVDVSSIELGTDGCSVPTFGATIAAFATAYATLARPETSASPHAASLTRLRDAMMAHPANVSGHGNFVTDIMDVGAGRIVAKTGAEGLICLGVPSEGLGIAVRLADGSFRSQPVIVEAVLRGLGLFDEAFFDELRARHPREIRNHNGWVVGEHRAIVELQRQVA